MNMKNCFSYTKFDSGATSAGLGAFGVFAVNVVKSVSAA